MSDPAEPNGDGLPDLATLIERRTVLTQRIEAAGGDPERVEIIAVTKRFPPRAVELAVAAGFTDIGENYAQELIEKTGLVTLDRQDSDAQDPDDRNPDDRNDAAPTWHMIGGLQRNKVKKLAAVLPRPTVGRLVLQTLDRLDLIHEVGKRLPGATVFLQVNTTNEAQKSGCEPSDVTQLVDEASQAGLDVAGLMTIGPTDGSDPTPAFELLRRLVDDHGLSGASMGMSADIDAAVASGSTMIRVGTALFGPRPTNL